MAGAARATISNELRERIQAALFAATHFRSTEEFEIKSMLRDAEKLSSVDAVMGTIAKAEIFALCGDRQQAEYWVRNARSNRADWWADLVETIIKTNLGYFSEGAEIYDRLAERAELHFVKGDALGLGIVTCSFNGFAQAAAQAAESDVDASSAEALLPIASQGTRVIQRLNINEAAVQAVLDVAGEIMRKHNLVWQRHLPELRFTDDDEGCGMLYQLYIGVDATAAMDLTDEVTALMIERDLDRSGVAFSFLSGTH